MWNDFVRAICPFAPAVRLKWSGDDAPTPWQPWMIIPVADYLEVGSLGPVPFREVEWVEVDPERRSEKGRLIPNDDPAFKIALFAAFENGKLPYTVSAGILRFCDGHLPESKPNG